MVDVRPTNAKLWARAARIVSRLTGLDEIEATKLLKKGGRVKVAVVMYHARVGAERALQLIRQNKGSLRAIIGDVNLHG
jgi:N-acetylmuramic acid 6-phosphate etherase